MQRSKNANLAAGATDGTYKKFVRDRGGCVETTTSAARESLFPVHYDITEDYMPQQPDGTRRRAEGSIHYMSPIRHQG